MREDLREEDIRPKELFDEYLRLVRQDIATHFVDDVRVVAPCPSCGREGSAAFTKEGFDYRECSPCLSLWASPRPTFENLATFYSASQSARYWAEVFSPAVEAARRVKLWRPKADRIAELIAELSHRDDGLHAALVDIGGGTGVFAQEYHTLTGQPVTVIEPSPQAAQACRDKGVKVVEAFLEDLAADGLPSGRRVFTSFELLEHVFDPRAWITSVSQLMGSGDALILTTLSSAGLDIRALWEHSASVNPPHHINFMAPHSIRNLGEQCGLNVVDVFTPGQLDVDIIHNNRDWVSDRVAQLIADGAPEDRSAWQSFIVERRLSSHMWAIFIKP